jgi:penicillin G amidase
VRARRFPGVVSRVLAIALLLAVVVILAWILYALVGLRSVAQTKGTVQARELLAPVRIVRDERDVPHIIASNDHDVMFAQGYAEASDRLFQMDLLRRFVYGRLAEVIGQAALPADENARVAPIARIVEAQWAHMNQRDRMLVQAYCDGVNAAMREQPLPVEFHLLLYKPQPWRPQDSLAAGMATVLDLIDRWDDVIRRDAVLRATNAPPASDLYSITDPGYDAPLTSSSIAPVPKLSSRTAHTRSHVVLAPYVESPAKGSNEWAIGATRSSSGNAILANDPHLRLGIPGVWYVVDLHSKNFHVAGGSLAGTPGVILGHNDSIAWGATNATVVTEVVYRDNLKGAERRVETFHVRFGRDVKFTYYQTQHGFAAETHGKIAYAVDWNATHVFTSPLAAFRGLDQARNIAEALRALQTYPGPPQNFVIADRSGAAAYQLAGLIPKDPQWGLRVHADSDPQYAYVPFDQLPHVRASRSGIVFTANNRTYGDGYPLRLSPNFAAPYRARRIQQLLSSKSRFSIADFASFQRDTLSFPERDIARATLAALQRKRAQRDPKLQPYIAALSRWDGRFDPDSRGAPIAWELRRIAVASLARYNTGRLSETYQDSGNNADLVLLMRVLRERPRGWWRNSDYDDLLTSSLHLAVDTYGARMLQTWGEYAKVTVKHPLSSLGFSFLNGATFPGDGDSFGPHVQTQTHSQSFRAVWDVGNWDAGGMVIPSGESGEPASGHYTDLSAAWVEQRLQPLPFSDSAVRASARATLLLTPAAPSYRR